MATSHLTGSPSRSSYALESLILADSNIWAASNESLPVLGSTFQSLAHYRSSLEALLLEEAKESVRSGFHDSAGESPYIPQVDLKRPSAAGRELNLRLRRVNESASFVVCSIEMERLLDREWLSPNTIVLIGHDLDDVRYCQEPESRHAIGLIRSHDLNRSELTVTIQIAPHNCSFIGSGSVVISRSALQGGARDSSIWLVPCTKISTFSQEYAALQSLEVLDRVS